MRATRSRLHQASSGQNWLTEAYWLAHLPSYVWDDPECHAHINSASEFHSKTHDFGSVSKIVEGDWRGIYFLASIARRADQRMGKRLEAHGFPVIFYLHADQKIIDALGDVFVSAVPSKVSVNGSVLE